MSLGSLGGILPLILMFVIFYFLLIRPQQKRQKQTANMQAGIAKGDMVVTIGGLHGLVDAVNEENNTITLKTADGSRMVFEKNAIRETRAQAK
ncbi:MULTISPECIES: preprotein translocase subunit YajC [unclassified Bacillus (in: firmicutes)]|uniref:preprotein translocase subunit YajC n=1 Tax=unclassified Bacillus (in: firmicutes) TaxID=185979 RepID=UPI000BF19D57|nr:MULTISPECIES: preprotein translocase subunit YajC [unclassified Bacillus (in: firmicutes)]PEJ51781.1 preprotein translocase subunit YajC [Bacillus sp. AFS002410]PEK98655.1 preprotein translocase subunit YajC [Bacillus sp. AFS017336]